jgi:mono/diheme cytochrome c family protein
MRILVERRTGPAKRPRRVGDRRTGRATRLRRVVAGCAAAVLVWSVSVFTQAPARQAATPPAPVTFAETIAPIVYANCASCHRPGEAAPFSLLTYDDVAKRAALIARVTESRYMPPWHAEAGYGEFVGERRLSEAQIAAFAEWAKTGMPRGDVRKAPAPPVFPVDGWRLGKPDLVLQMPAGFDVPASGPDVFRNFVIPTNLTDDKWVRAIEFRPSARKVVHHALFAQVAGGSLALRDGADGRPGFGGMGTVGAVGDAPNGLGGWAVGATPMFLPQPMVGRLPKGSDFLLQLHFHPSGKPEREQSLIGIYFAEKGPEKPVFEVGLPALFGVGAGIDIAAGEKRFVIADSVTLPADVTVYSAVAHAHYLAKDMKATATMPDGTTKTLFWIDDWDFNWQDTYVFKRPFTLPKGTRIDATISYDNSAENPRNPASPPRRAIFGEQSFDEMGLIGFVIEAVNEADASAIGQALAARQKAAIAAGGKDGTLGRVLARQQRLRQPMQQLTVFDRQGAVVSRVAAPGRYSQASFSPDGARIAVIKSDPDADTQDVWAFDVATGTGIAITADAVTDSAPVWSPDGAHIAYVSVRDTVAAIYRRASNGTGPEEELYVHRGRGQLVLTDWSSDGRLCFWVADAMYLLPLTGDRKPIELAKDPFVGRGGRVSPDGQLLAFNASRAPGRFDVFVAPLEPNGASSKAVQLSAAPAIGGIVWRRDAKEVFYLSMPPQSLMAVDVASGSAFQASAPRELFKLSTPVGAPAQLSAVASGDGQRFVFAVDLPPRTAARPTP